MEVYESSEKLKSIKQRKESELIKLDFSKLNVGESCVIKIKDVKESSLRTKVSTAKKKLGFNLVCTKHIDDGLFEIGRIK
jgi:hypothetical protein